MAALGGAAVETGVLHGRGGDHRTPFGGSLHLDRYLAHIVHAGCGDRDGFAPITQLLRSRIEPTPAGGIEPGRHDSTYWRSQASAQLAFVSRRLT